MNRSILLSALLATLSLAACDKPTTVNMPTTPVAVPGPAGPQGTTGTQGEAGSPGATGSQGEAGDQGKTGASGDATVIVMPPQPAAPAN